MTTIDYSATDGFTDEDWEIADRLIEDGLRTADRRGLSPSAAARKAKCSTSDAHRILKALVKARMALTSGNGAWTHYHDYDRNSDPTLKG